MVREAKVGEATGRAPGGRSRRLRTRPSWKVPAAILVVLLVATGVYFVSTQSANPYTPLTPVTEMCIQHSATYARHDHAHISITILGATRQVPDDTGITSRCMRPLHTHKGEPNRIHVESPVPHEFTLRDFFTVWTETGGAPFTQTTIMGYYANATHEIVMKVNGVASDAYENYVFPHDTDRNGEPTITISYQAR
jgi:hypothetical protein